MAEIAYEEMEPVAKPYDEAAGWPLLKFLHAYFMPMQKIDDIVRDTDEGPGWSILFDPDRCPARYLAFPAMFAGVVLRPNMTEEEKRSRIKNRDGLKRCTPGAIVQAAKDNLDPAIPMEQRDVILRERYNPADPLVDSPGHFQIITYTAQTPDPDAVLAAIRQHKDVDFVMHYDVVDGQDWQQLVNDFGTWQDVVTAYPTWQDVIEDTPS